MGGWVVAGGGGGGPVPTRATRRSLWCAIPSCTCSCVHCIALPSHSRFSLWRAHSRRCTVPCEPCSAARSAARRGATVLETKRRAAPASGRARGAARGTRGGGGIEAGDRSTDGTCRARQSTHSRRFAARLPRPRAMDRTGYAYIHRTQTCRRGYRAGWDSNACTTTRAAAAPPLFYIAHPPAALVTSGCTDEPWHTGSRRP